MSQRNKKCEGVLLLAGKGGSPWLDPRRVGAASHFCFAGSCPKTVKQGDGVFETVLEIAAKSLTSCKAW